MKLLILTAVSNEASQFVASDMNVQIYLANMNKLSKYQIDTQ